MLKKRLFISYTVSVSYTHLPEAKVADDIFWAENEQRGNMHVMPVSQHKTAGPQN